MVLISYLNIGILVSIGSYAHREKGFSQVHPPPLTLPGVWMMMMGNDAAVPAADAAAALVWCAGRFTPTGAHSPAVICRAVR